MYTIKKKNTASASASNTTEWVLMILTVLLFLVVVSSCSSSAGSPSMQQPAQVLPVITVSSQAATTHREFNASIEGSRDIEIRPQVDGTLDKIYIDEGAYVKKGQPLFLINARPYQEQLNNARASLAAAKAQQSSASINVEKLTPLVQNKVVSDVQLKTANANYDAARANVAQAQAQVQAASINVGYTIIKAPVDGYVGRIPFRTGSIVTPASLEPLTVVSGIKEIYAYFSFSEKDFLEFSREFPGVTIEEKIKQVPGVELMLADNSIYSQKGKVETVTGQFDNSMGSISFRASFPNDAGLLRSGTTGKIRIPRSVNNAIIVPQEATYEMQDKTFVFLLVDSNKVTSSPITIAGRSGNYYLVEKGIKAGDRIVFAGLDRLRDGAIIQPEQLSLDSLLKRNPL